MIKILRTTTYVCRILQDCPPGWIHSIYRGAVNLCFEDELVALQPRDSHLSPLSLLCDLSGEDILQLPLAEGMPVHWDPQTRLLTLGEAGIFSLCPPEQICDLTLQPNPESLPRIHSCIQEIRRLPAAKTEFFRMLLEPEDRLGELSLVGSLQRPILRKHLEDCENALSAAAPADAVSHLLNLMGAGTGLTPSGDDFLCGVLAALLLTRRWNSPFAQLLRSGIFGHLNRTNPISGAFLRCACREQFAEAVHLLTGGTDSESPLPAFARIGHSSGIDTLTGVLWGLNLTLPA